MTISTFFSAERSRIDIGSIQARLSGLQRQVASGYKADTLSGYGEASGRLLSVRGILANSEQRALAARTIEPRLAVQAGALRQNEDAIAGLRQSVLDAVINRNGAALGTIAESRFQQARAALSQQYDGVFVFAGERVDGAPVTVNTLDELAARGDPSGAIVNGERPQTFDLGDGLAINLAPLASEISSGFFAAVGALKQYIDQQGGLSASLSDAQIETLQGFLPLLDQARASAGDAEGRNGLLQQRVEAVRIQEEERVTLFTGTLGRIADADLADVSARIGVARSQFEAVATLFSELRSLSLLSFLR